jgi:hypothetical protein
MRKNRRVRVSPRPLGRGSATKEQLWEIILEFAFERKNMALHIFLFESEAKQGGPRKETSSARAPLAGVEDLKWRRPELVEGEASV